MRVRVDAVVERGEALGFLVVVADATEERKWQRQVELADRMRTVATMIAGLAAEVHNPLAILGANATFAEEELAAHTREVDAALDDAGRERLRGIAKLVGNARAAGLRIAKLVADLRTFAASPDAKGHDRANVSLAVLRATTALSSTIERRARLAIEVDDGLEAPIDAGRLTQLVTHLVSNAALALDEGAAAKNTISVVARAADGGVTVEVRDTGCGIPAEHRERVFEPFFTTRAVGGGMGLGLSVCAGIAASARGRLEVTSEVGAGTTVRLVLPSG